MRSRIRLFLLVGVLATAVDVGVLVALVAVVGSEIPALVGADAVALVLAALLAYGFNRNVTFRGQPDARWVRHPGLFTATAVGAGVIDGLVLVALHRAGLVLAGAKALAVGSSAIIRWVVYRRILLREVRRELGERVVRPPSPGDLRLSVVIPAYGEEDLIAGTVAAVRAELDQHLEPAHYEIVVVDDGSPDATAARAARAGARVVALGDNQGKGAAVRAGVASARGRAVVFTDADLAYPPALIVEIMDQVEQGWDVVVGSRRHDDANTLVRARRLRELGGRVINLLTRIVLLGHFHDTQCGIKGFRGDVGKAIFERTRIDGFAFDVEIFLIAEQDRFSLTEMPVSVTNRQGSSVRIVGDTLGLLVALVKIRRWAGRGRYRPQGDQAELLSSPSGWAEPGSLRS